jgi:pimeloyl-ACP methyl ester carboxylesterase
MEQGTAQGSDVDERTIDLGEVSLRIAEAGQGGRPFLLVHGFTGSKDDFLPWLDRLAELGFHAVAPDLRGHGASDKPEGADDYSLEVFADDLAALVDALGWSELAILGHSMGGMIVQTLVLRDPSRCEALVLMDTSHGPIVGLDRTLLPLAVQVIDDGGMEGLVAVMKELGGVLDTPAGQALRERDPAYDAHAWETLANTSGAMWKTMAPALLDQPDRLDRLSSLSMPTLVLVGDQDQPFIPDSERMAEAIPRARLVVLPESGHCPQFENEGPWWQALSGFLAEAPAPA